MAETDELIGDLHLATVVINVQDMSRAVGFWTAALGYVQREQDCDPQFMMLVDPAGRQLPVSLQLADSPPKEPARVPWTCTPADRPVTWSGWSGSGRHAWTTGPIPTAQTLLSCATRTAMSSA